MSLASTRRERVARWPTRGAPRGQTAASALISGVAPRDPSTCRESLTAGSPLPSATPAVHFRRVLVALLRSEFRRLGGRLLPIRQARPRQDVLGGAAGEQSP